MNTQLFDFAQTGAFSALFLDYIQGQPKLQDFYGLKPSIENFAAQIEQKKNSYSSEFRQVLFQTIQNQYQSINLPAPQNLELILQENTFTVTTGHQLNIFTGPLYFIYKIITTINLSEALKKQYPQYNFLPVYWLASEDHDFAEINHFHLFGKKYTWESEQSGAVGRFKTESISSLLAEVPEKPDFFAQAYQNNATLSEATRYLAHHLFPNSGLICLDADEKSLKSLFSPIIAQEILHINEAKTSFQAVKETSEKLENQGYKTQVNPREINFFYMDSTLRERLVKDETTENYQVLNTSLGFQKKEIAEIIEKTPEKFSPNVILRPLYQEWILPNLAYIGGPGELAYWLQLKGVFDLYQTPFPILMPRNFALIINKTNLKKQQKLGISNTDIFLSAQKLKEKFVETNSQVKFDIKAENEAISQLFDQILQKAGLVDKSLEGFVGAEKQKTLKSIENIEKRLEKAEEQKLDTEIKQLLAFKDKLFPEGDLQERVDNLLNFYLNQPDFIDFLRQTFDPFSFKFYLLQENA
jgi:bacillithiol biosynthesis cysteine-adding enzyme BshC